MLIATAQSLVSQDIEANGREIRALMQKAHEAGARLVSFPEGAVSGYKCADKLDVFALRLELDRIASVARSLGLWTVLGSEHPLTPPNRPHNSLYIISDEGELITRYDKRFCSHTEISDHYTPGLKPVVFSVDGFTFGCAICIEIQFPELFIDYEKRGVDCLLFSSYSDDPLFGVLAQAHAATNNCWFSVSVPAQCAESMPAGIIGPNGSWISRCTSHHAPDIAVVELNRLNASFDISLNKARPWRRLARKGDIYARARRDDSRSDDKTHF